MATRKQQSADDAAALKEMAESDEDFASLASLLAETGSKIAEAKDSVDLARKKIARTRRLANL